MCSKIIISTTKSTFILDLIPRQKHTVCKHLQNSSFVYITKNSNLCNVLACNSILDFQMTKHLKMIIGMLATITNNLMNIRIFAFVV